MLIYLNKPLILEHVIKEVLEQYFASLMLDSYYKNWAINVTCEHPFALMLSQGAFNKSLFPSIVVSTISDEKPMDLANLFKMQELHIVKEDIPKLKEKGYMVCNEVIERLEKEIKERDELLGVTHIIRRNEKIAIEIWSENIQLKNELYEHIRLFIAGGIHEATKKYQLNNNLVIFDRTLQGDRSGNYNYDFGVTLVGSRLTFEADYFIEQSLLDTELKCKNVIWEVKDYVKRG